MWCSNFGFSSERIQWDNGSFLDNCHGQVYDGASNMAGHLNRVATCILKEAPNAYYVHCLAHSLNFCLQDCTVCRKTKLMFLTVITALLQS